MLSDSQHALLQTAVEHQLADRYEAAAEIYERLLAAAPGDFQVNHLLGALRHQQGRPAEAVKLLERARAEMPLSAPTLMCLGLALAAVGRKVDAEKALCAAVGLDSKSPENWANLGAFYATLGRSDHAIGAYRRALEIKPDYAAGWTGLGAVFHLGGRSIEAVECHTRALAIDPDDRKARFGRAQAFQACHRFDEALADFDAQLKVRPDHHEARSFRLFMLNYRDDLSREEVFAEHVAYGKAVEAAVSAERNFPNEPDPGRRLKVAFLSPDLRTHSVSFFLGPLLRYLDRGQFDILLYHDHFSVDGVSEKLRARTALWRQFSGIAHSAALETIRKDAPDILVDLTGHTGFNRMELLARRMAPVQISYLGYPNTTGLSTMDFRLTDAIADPPGETEHLHTERLIRFGPTAWAYEPWPETPEPAPAPSPESPGVTFGSFNALSKLSPSTLRLWREVIEAVPGSRLLLKSSGMDEAHWCERLLKAGFPESQFSLLPMSPTIPEHLAAYSQVDVALDPFPYNGTTTTCEALWMGVPVVTLAGDRHASRVGASLLTAVGHPDWIASSPAEYVRIASNLARAELRRQALRDGLRREMRRSPLCDYAAHAECFGAALREAWMDWCGSAGRDGRPARPFALSVPTATARTSGPLVPTLS